MRRPILLSLCLEVIALSLLLTINCSNSEHSLFTNVFVLETSDSSDQNEQPAQQPITTTTTSTTTPATRSKSNPSPDDSNTRIITDSESGNPTSSEYQNANSSPKNKQQNKAPTTHQSHEQSEPKRHSQPTNSDDNQTHNDEKLKPTKSNQYSSPDEQHNHQQADQQQQYQADEGRRREAADARRVEDATQYSPPKSNPTIRSTNNQAEYNNNQQQQHQRQKSTTPSPYENSEYSGHQSSTPKVEDKLLIHIDTHGEYDPNNYKPHKSNNNNNNDYEDGFQPVHQQQNNPNKRKPAITISIQDANISKQIGGGGSAVIVRPGENGQIVISTVNTPSNNNNKYNTNSNNNNNNNNHQRPITNPNPSQISSGGSSSHISEQQPPYREPVNNPIQNIINQHLLTSTSRRPSVNNDYIPPSSRPTASYVEPQRPPPVSDERPHRPVVSLDDHQGGGSSSNYESTSSSNSNNNNNRPTSRPTQTSRPTSSNHEDGYESNTNSRPTEDSYVPTGSEPKYPLNERNCGLVHETKIVGGEEAEPDDFLWMAAIIKSRPKEGEARPFCGGALITRRHILTAAHCLEGLAPRDVLVRLGSYDFDDSTASSLSADFAIDQFRVPGQYSKKTHVADIAIIRLKTPLASSDNYKTVCMPQPRRSYVGALGTVTGYGSQSQTFRRATPKLRQVTVPIWENRKCAAAYKRNMTESFMCAGYEDGGKDACQGDSGGPLMTEGPNEKMMIVGVVSHGIGCGSPGYPGVYTRTTTFLDWIEKNTKE